MISADGPRHSQQITQAIQEATASHRALVAALHAATAPLRAQMAALEAAMAPHRAHLRALVQTISMPAPRIDR